MQYGRPTFLSNSDYSDQPIKTCNDMQNVCRVYGHRKCYESIAISGKHRLGDIATVSIVIVIKLHRHLYHKSCSLT